MLEHCVGVTEFWYETPVLETALGKCSLISVISSELTDRNVLDLYPCD